MSDEALDVVNVQIQVGAAIGIDSLDTKIGVPVGRYDRGELAVGAPGGR
jgi:hypothetical protein